MKSKSKNRKYCSIRIQIVFYCFASIALAAVTMLVLSMAFYGVYMLVQKDGLGEKDVPQRDPRPEFSGGKAPDSARDLCQIIAELPRKGQKIKQKEKQQTAHAKYGKYRGRAALHLDMLSHADRGNICFLPAVRLLRRMKNAEIIKTVWGVGYRIEK